MFVTRITKQYWLHKKKSVEKMDENV